MSVSLDTARQKRIYESFQLILFMPSKLFSIGDVVTLKTHPYIKDLTNIIIAGDATMLPPLMIVMEIQHSKKSVEKQEIDLYKYHCVWFSSRTNRFIQAWIVEADLKLITTAVANINQIILKRGDRVVLKSASHELGKQKSSFTCEDNSTQVHSGNTHIRPLLSFLSPVMQVLTISKFSPKDLKKETYYWEVKCSMYDPINDKISEVVLPLESLELIEPIDENLLNYLADMISKDAFLYTNQASKKSILKPRSIVFLSGFYYLRGLDLLCNRIIEVPIDKVLRSTETNTPFITEVPSFRIENTPQSATPHFIIQEIVSASKHAIERKNYLRIKYRNKNDEVSLRTVIPYKVLSVKEDDFEIFYLNSYCLSRQAERNFRISRIQHLQEIKLSFDE